MPNYRISVINHAFNATDEYEMDTQEAAENQGLKSALSIGTDEVLKGKPFFAAEVRVEHGTTLSRFVVSVGASPIQ